MCTPDVSHRSDTGAGFTAQAAAALALAVLATCMSGCASYLDLKRPPVRNYLSDGGKSAPEAVPPPRSPSVDEIAEALARWEYARGDVKEAYQVGPGDVLHLAVYPAKRPDGGSSVQIPVGERGTIGLPYLGEVQVAGLTTAEIKEGVAGLYAEDFYRDPVVTVVVTKHVSKQLLVSGEVASPGVITLTSNRISLLEAILRAGGMTPEGSGVARLTRAAPEGEGPPGGGGAEPVTREIDMVLLLTDPTLQRNIWVYPDDVVYVPSLAQEQRWFVVLGYVRAPGVYPMEPNVSLTLLDAVGHARGVNGGARSEHSRLLRRFGTESEEIHRVDITRIASAKSSDIVLQHGDILIVGTSFGRRLVSGVLNSLGLRSLATF